MIEDHDDAVKRITNRRQEQPPTQRVEISTPETDGDNGVANIFRAFLRNPVAAFEIIGFIGGLYGVYYAIEGEIHDVRAAQVANYEKLTSKLDLLITADADEQRRIAELYTRGDTRYQSLIGRINDQEVAIGKLGTGIDYLVKQSDKALGR